MTCTAELCAGRVSGALQAHYGHERNVPKRLSRRLGFTPRAFQNWQYGRSSPGLHDLIKLMAECETLRNEVDRLVLEARDSLNEKRGR